MITSHSMNGCLHFITLIEFSCTAVKQSVRHDQLPI